MKNKQKKSLPKTQDIPETKRILPKTPNRAHTEMSVKEDKQTTSPGA